MGGKGSVERFVEIARDLIEQGNKTESWGDKSYRRSLGPTQDRITSLRRGQCFMQVAATQFPGYNFGITDVEGTGGTRNLRVRAFCRGPLNGDTWTRRTSDLRPVEDLVAI